MPLFNHSNAKFLNIPTSSIGNNGFGFWQNDTENNVVRWRPHNNEGNWRSMSELKNDTDLLLSNRALASEPDSLSNWRYMLYMMPPLILLFCILCYRAIQTGCEHNAINRRQNRSDTQDTPKRCASIV